MARQMLMQKYDMPQSTVALKQNQSKADNKKKVADSETGLKRLGASLTHAQYLSDIAPSSKFKKMQKRTMEKVVKKIDRQKLSTVIQMLNTFEQNKEKKEKIDAAKFGGLNMKKQGDYNKKYKKEKFEKQTQDNQEQTQSIYWNITFDKNIEFHTEKTRIKLIGGSTAVQIKLPNSLKVDPKVILFVREGDTYKYQQEIGNAGSDLACVKKVCTVRELHEEIEKKNNNFFNKNLLKRMLNEYDYILIDKRITLTKAARELGGGMQILMRKRKFPFPVKLNALSTKELIASISEPVMNSSHFMLSGGKEFLLECATTNLEVKDSVKNVLYTLLRTIPIILHAQETTNKHNRILKIDLKTDASIPIPIYENDELEQIEENKQMN